MADNTYQRGYRPADPYGRSAAPAGQAPDPLTELARLIGQNDPFADAVGGMPGDQSRQGNRSDQEGRDPRYSSAGYGRSAEPSDNPEQQMKRAGYSSEEEQYDRSRADGRDYGQRYFHPDERFEQDPRGYDLSMRGGEQRHDHDDVDGSYFDERGGDQGEDPYEDPPVARRRGGLIAVAAIVGLAVIGTAGAFAYRAVFGGPGQAPVIRADNSPNKVVPASQASDMSSGKQIYDRFADRGQNERIVSREEQPVDMRETSRVANPRVIVPPTSQPAASSPAGAAPGIAALASTASSPAPQPAGMVAEPKKIRTVTIKSDQVPADPSDTRAQMRASSAGTAAGPQQSTARQAIAVPTANGPLSLTPSGVASGTPSSVVATPAAPSAVPRAAAPSLASVGPRTREAGNFVVQLSAQKSEAEAQTAFRGMQVKYPNQLRGREPIIRRKDLGEKGVFYGVQVGPFASRDDAVQLCEKLRAAGGSCIVQRN